MSFSDDRVFLDHPDDVQLYDTSLGRNGAPGVPGETRRVLATLESGREVVQVRRLTLVNVGANVAKGSLLEKEAGNAYNADALLPADTANIRTAGAVPYGINRNKLGGVAAGTLPGSATADYWAWLVIEGEVDLLADANLATDVPLISKAASAAGRVDDPAVTGLEHAILGRSLEAVTGGAGTLFEAYINVR